MMRFLLLWVFALMFCSYVDAQGADTSTQMFPLEHKGIPTFAWSNDGDLLAIGAAQAIRIYHIDQAEPILIIPDQISVQELAFNLAGSLLASVDSRLIVHVWDTETGQSIASREFGDYGFITRLNFHPDEAVLTLSFWGVGNGAAVLPTGIWFWEYTRDEEPRVIRTSEALGEALQTFNQDLTLVVTAQGSSQQGSGLPVALLNVREVSSGEIIQQWGAVRPVFRQLVFNPTNPDLLLSIDVRGVVRLWNAREGIELFALTLPYDLVTTAAFTTDGVLVATGGTDGKVRLWAATDGALLEVFDNQPESVQQLRMTGENDILGLALTDQLIEIWDVRSGRMIASFELEAIPPED